MVQRLLSFLLLFAFWLILSGLFDAFHLALGLISCALVTWWSSDLLFESRGSLKHTLTQGWRLAGYLAWLLWQIVLSNIHLFQLSFGSLKEVSPRIVKFRTGLKTDFAKFLLANSITVTPGTITVKILGDVFYVHAISEAAAGLDGGMERRIAAIFEPETVTDKAAA